MDDDSAKILGRLERFVNAAPPIIAGLESPSRDFLVISTELSAVEVTGPEREVIEALKEIYSLHADCAFTALTVLASSNWASAEKAKLVLDKWKKGLESVYLSHLTETLSLLKVEAITGAQKAGLEAIFKEYPNPTFDESEYIANASGLTLDQVLCWFSRKHGPFVKYAHSLAGPTSKRYPETIHPRAQDQASGSGTRSSGAKTFTFQASHGFNPDASDIASSSGMQAPGIPSFGTQSFPPTVQSFGAPASAQASGTQPAIPQSVVFGTPGPSSSIPSSGTQASRTQSSNRALGTQPSGAPPRTRPLETRATRPFVTLLSGRPPPPQQATRQIYTVTEASRAQALAMQASIGMAPHPVAETLGDPTPSDLFSSALASVTGDTSENLTSDALQSLAMAAEETENSNMMQPNATAVSETESADT